MSITSLLAATARVRIRCWGPFLYTCTDTWRSTMSDSSNRPTIMLVDGYGLIFRAYHAIDPSMATSEGEQTNAVFGFARMLLDVIDGQKPDYAIVALEGGRTFREDLYEDYKANRGAMPDDLRS